MLDSMNADTETKLPLHDSPGTEYPPPWISGEVMVRNPFRVVRLPWVCRQYIRLHYRGNQSSFKGLLKTSVKKRMVAFGRRFMGKERGIFSLLVNGEERHFNFNPLNT